jgi:outer membrane protein assembly factor BamB
VNHYKKKISLAIFFILFCINLITAVGGVNRNSMIHGKDIINTYSDIKVKNNLYVPLWTFDITSNAYGGSAVDDIDNDGKMEIVFGTYMGDSKVYALNSENGSLLWNFYSGPGPVDASIKIADVNNDGNKEVVFAGSGSGYMDNGSYGVGIIHVLNGTNGDVIWEYNTGYCVDSPAAIVDIDNDNIKEVIYGAWKEGDDLGYVRILNGINGTLEQKIGGFDGYIQSEPNILDLNDDGQLDIVIATFQGDNKIYAINGSDYNTLWMFQANDWMYHGGSFGDIDNDGLPEIAIGSYDDHIYVINGEDGSLNWSYNVGSYILAPTSIADVDNDGSFEIFAATNTMYAFTHNGVPLWNYPTGGLIWRGASISDIDGDEWLDICFCSDDGLIRIVNGTTGNLIWSFDAEADYGETFEIDHAPIITDLNEDGKLDVFFVGGYGVYPPNNNYGRAYAFSVSNGTGIGWYMFRHDYRNSGCYSTVYNNPPSTPSIPLGSTSGNIGINYSYITNTTDSDDDKIYYKWNWGDNISDWMGPYNSNEICNTSHSWTETGIYNVSVRAKDQWGHLSNWSNNLLVNIVNNIYLTNLVYNWNFISLPINQTAEKTDIIVKHGFTNYSWSDAVSENIINDFIFGWNRISQSYNLEDLLEPGYGYWMYAYDICELWINNKSINTDDYITESEVNWNILGLPYYQNVSKTDILVDETPWDYAVTMGIINDFVFGWNYNTQSYIFAEMLEPGFCYWMYAYQQCTLKKINV